MKWIMRSIRTKLIISFISVILLPLLLSIYISYRNFAHELEQSYIVNNTVILKQLNNRFDDYFIQLENTGLTYYSDLLFSQEYQMADHDFSQHNLKLKKLMSLYLANKETNSVLFYTPLKQELYVINKALNTSFPKASAVESKGWYRAAVSSPNTLVLKPSHLLQGYPPEYRIQESSQVFSLSRMIRGYSSEIGVLTINYGMDQLQRISGTGILSPEEEITLLDNQGVMIYSSNPLFSKLDDALLARIQSGPEMDGSFHYMEPDSQEAKLMLYSKSGHNGNLLLKLIPLPIILAQAEKTRTINVLLALTIILILIVTTMYISFRLTRSLLQLKRLMVKAGEGDFQAPIAVTQTDEIGQISHAYNRMIQQIDTLITEKYKMKLANQESQWKALQAQINPHFMYNTLQTICSVALDEGIDELVRMTQALSDMLRYSIKPGERATLQDEIGNVTDYLFIQACRFEEKLEYRIEAPAAVRHLQVPKLLLQPLVENAIIHGLEPAKHRGKIVLECSLDQGYLRISISDNGIGIMPGKLAELQASMDAPDVLTLDKRDSIGIVNVRQRLQLMFGGECCMRIHSRPQEGTRIEIAIPVGIN
ncbi:cache domain-containing sensor histidine kinase [Paenibacillus puerhi]|uniref:cache domain-containing sensor histidine kinase n=1 Tax=Paenibacillus puerhi TaxID=2692622 RepID=UPI001357B12B|nr:sensor histidine kinase [Paenibacillus puerhi]